MFNLSELNLNSITCNQPILFRDEDFNTWEITIKEEWDTDDGYDGEMVNDRYFSTIVSRVSRKDYGYNYAESTGHSIASAVVRCLWELELVDENTRDYYC